MPDPKKQLNITLTEPIVFLRTPDPSGQHPSDPSDPPTLVRGILTLNVAKPIEISSIEAELTGMLAFSYPEAYGPRRIDLPEKHKIYSSTVTIFRADQIPRGRYSASVGPGLSASNSNEDEHVVTTLPRLPSLPRGRTVRRNIVNVPLDLGPTPPYTVTESSPIQSRLTVPGEHPAQTLEELRQALRENLEGQSGFISPSSLPHVASSFPILRTHSNASSTSNELPRLENGSHTDDLLPTSSPLEGDTSFRNVVEDPSHVLAHSGPSPSPFRAHSSESIRRSRPRACGNGSDLSNASTSHSRLRLSLTSVLDAVREITSRAPSRSGSIARSEEGERGRTRFRVVAEEQRRESILELSEGVDPENGSELGRNVSDLTGHSDRREHHLLGLGRVLGWERDHDKEKDDEHKSKERGESWREFQPGTYSYPISFLLPPHLPPTFSLLSGSLDYVIKGVAHRPGAFTSKLSCQVPLLVVASPAVGTGEGGVAGDPGPLFIQKEWQTKLAYSIGLSSRLFLLGSERRLEAANIASNTSVADSLPAAAVEARAEAAYGTSTLEITFLPIEKIKIWRLDVLVDQRIRYVDDRGKSVREDEKRQVRVLEVQDRCSEGEIVLTDGEEQTGKNEQKRKQDFGRIPLLPTPLSPHRSPLLRYLPPSSDPSILAGPGPYTLSTSIGLPGCIGPSGSNTGGLHFTVKHKGSAVRVEHSLRLVMRVESVGEEDTNDHGQGNNKRIFDIAVQTPITILSCRCVPEYQTLPRYSPNTEDSLQNCVACPCHPSAVGPGERGHELDVENDIDHIVTPSSASSFDSENCAFDEHRSGYQHSRSPSRVGRSGPVNPLTASLHPHPQSPTSWSREAGWSRSPSLAPARSHVRPHHVRSPSDSVSTTHTRVRSQTPGLQTPHPSRPPSPLARYERLVSGLESEAGEAPPSYESVASGP